MLLMKGSTHPNRLRVQTELVHMNCQFCRSFAGWQKLKSLKELEMEFNKALYKTAGGLETVRYRPRFSNKIQNDWKCKILITCAGNTTFEIQTCQAHLGPVS